MTSYQAPIILHKNRHRQPPQLRMDRLGVANLGAFGLGRADLYHLNPMLHLSLDCKRAHPNASHAKSSHHVYPETVRTVVLLTLLLAVASCASPSVDWNARYRAQFSSAQEADTMEAYRSFLRQRAPSGGGFEFEQEAARTALVRLELQEALGQDLEHQVEFISHSIQNASRNQIFASVREKLTGKSRVERMQWLWPIGRRDDGLLPDHKTYLSENLGLMAQERTLWESQDWAQEHPANKSLGPYGLAALSDLELTRALVRVKSSSGRWSHNDFLWAALLHASSLNSALKWAPVGQPFANGGETTPRQEALRVVKRVLIPKRVAVGARETDTLAGERAWSMLRGLIETKWFRSDMDEAFQLLNAIDRPEVIPSLLPIALGTYSKDRVPCLLRCLRLEVPGLQDHLPAWIASDDWTEQAFAALVIAHYRIHTAANLEQLRRWEGSPQRGLRNATRHALEALGETPIIEEAHDTQGLASAARHFEAIERGLIAPEEAVHLKGQSQLPRAPRDWNTESDKLVSPRTTLNGSFVRQAPYRHQFQANCRALEFAAAPQEYWVDPLLNPEEEGLRIPTFAVLIRDQPLAPDPDDEKAFLLYPQVSFCCQDRESGQILVGYEDYGGMKFRPAVTDVAQAAKSILSRQGLKAPFKNHRAGVVLIISEALLQSGDKEIASQVKWAWITFLQCVNSHYGEKLYANYKSAWWKLPPLDPGFIRGKPLLNSMSPREPAVQQASAEILRAHAFVPDATKNRYTLSLSPAAGTIARIRDVEGRLVMDIQTESGEAITIPELLASCMPQGSEVTRGQVLGLRFREGQE